MKLEMASQPLKPDLISDLMHHAELFSGWSEPEDEDIWSPIRGPVVTVTAILQVLW